MPEITEPIKEDSKKPNIFQKLKMRSKLKGNSDRSGLWGKIGFTLGIVSIGTWLIPILGLIIAVPALVFNIIGLRAERGRWFAVAGLTLSIIFLNLTFIYGFYNVLVSMLGSAGF